MGKANIVMDMSQFDLFELCACRYDYRYNKNLVPPVKSMRLDRGQLVHVGAEFYYGAISKGAPYADAVSLALSKIREAGVIASELEPEVITRVMDVMEEYFDYWRHEDQNLQITEVERPFIYLLHEDDEVRFHLAGKIDLLYNERIRNNAPMDHKSYDRDFPIHRMSNQFKNYAYALGSDVLTVNRIGFQKTLKPHEKFYRKQLSFDKIGQEEWKDNVIKVLFQYLECVATDIWPMNYTSCDKYNRKCEYFEVCDASGKEAKFYKLNADFKKVEPWDVSKALRRPSEIIEDARKEKEEVVRDGYIQQD